MAKLMLNLYRFFVSFKAKTIKQVLKQKPNQLHEDKKDTVILKTGRFDNINSSVIIHSSVSKAVTAAVFFLLKLFSSYSKIKFAAQVTLSAVTFFKCL